MEKQELQIIGVQRVQQIWPKNLYRELRQLALDEETTATDLTIQAVKMFLDMKRKEGKGKAKKKS